MRTRLALALSFAAAMSAVHADIAWKGTISEGQKSQFALTDTATGESKWVKLGQSFESYSVSRYDEATQQLTLSKNGSTVQLSLASSHYTEPPPAVPSNDDLRALSGFRLARALAARGDTTLQALLNERLDYIQHRTEIIQILADGERKVRAASPDAPSPVALKSYRIDLERWNKEIARIDGEIHVAADISRRALLGNGPQPQPTTPRSP